MTTNAIGHHIDISHASSMSVVVLVSQWNSEVTYSMRDAALQTLEKHGVKKKRITVRYVPGCFELTAAACLSIEHVFPEIVICIGCVVRGETPHFDYICQAVSAGLTQITVKHNIPVVFGVLTVDSIEQALDRAGGKYGNKGEEAAMAALQIHELTFRSVWNDDEEYEE